MTMKVRNLDERALKSLEGLVPFEPDKLTKELILGLLTIAYFKGLDEGERQALTPPPGAN